MSENVQQLNYEFIQKASEKYANVIETNIYLEIDGEEVPFMVEIYKFFSPTLVKEFGSELIEKIEKVKSVNKDGFGDIIMPYVMFLTVKHFTTLKLPNNFYEQVLAIENMLNTGALMQIYLHFDEKEIEKLQQEIEFIVENFNVNLDSLIHYQKTVEDKISDKSLLV